MTPSEGLTEDLRADLVVVGAGAAGLWAAEVGARAGRSVLLLEKTPRTGTKVLASGGTRCNLTTTLGPREAGALFGREGARFLATALRALPPLAVRERFASWGVATEEAPLEKVFPVSGRARDVRDALENAARVAGARIVLDAAVEHLEPRDGGWRVSIAGGRAATCARLILCPGGKSYARTGTTGDGYRWLDDLGLEEVEPVPALAPLSSDAPWVKELAGVSLQDVEARLTDEQGTVLGRRRRPVLFTHRGVSGPGAMDLSEPVARAESVARRTGKDGRARLTLLLDLVPRIAHERLRELLRDAAARAEPLARALPAEIPRRVLDAVLGSVSRAAGASPNVARTSELDRAARHTLVETLKGLPVPVNGTLGFDLAEVTAGGLALSELDAGTMRVKRHPGLYVVGELLDLQGPIGGLNFQSAFASAELAARDAARG